MPKGKAVRLRKWPMMRLGKLAKNSRNALSIVSTGGRLPQDDNSYSKGVPTADVCRYLPRLSISGSSILVNCCI
jgi:hypothetical protein